MTDHDPLARRSHAVEDVALTMARGGADPKLIAYEVESAEETAPEVIAMALAYLLRRRNDAAPNGGDECVERAIDGVVAALRRVT